MNDTPRSRRRKWPYVLAGLAITLILAVKIVEYLIDVDRYRPLVIQKIEEQTGMAASVERLDLSWLPLPAVHAYHVVVGDPDFQARAAEVRATARLGSLFRGRLDVDEVVVYGATATLPEELGDVAERVRASAERRPEPRAEAASGSTRRVAVERVRVAEVRVYWGTRPDPVLVGAGDVVDVLADRIPLRGEFRAPLFGPEARLEVEGAVTRRRGGTPAFTPEGSARLTGMDTAHLLDNPALPRLRVEARAALADYTPGQLRFEVEGRTAAVEDETPLAEVASGTFVATAWWSEGSLIVNNFDWAAPGLSLLADLTRDPAGTFACEIREAALSGEALGGWLSGVRSEHAVLSADADAGAEAADVLLGFERGKALRLVRGTASFRGVRVALPDGAAPFDGLSGRLRFEENVAHIEELAGRNLALAGRLVPDLETRSVAMTLGGGVTLTRELALALVKTDALEDIAGAVRFDRISATWRAEQKGLPDLMVEGRLDGGRATVSAGAFRDKLDGVAARFSGTPGEVRATATGTSERLGRFETDAVYHASNGSFELTPSLDLTKIDLAPDAPESTRALLATALAAYGASRFDVAARPRSGSPPRYEVSVVRQGAPELTAALVIARPAQGWGLESLTAATDLPVDVAAGMFPPALDVGGRTRVSAAYTPGQGPLRAEADLTQVTLRAGPFLHKRAGDRAALRLTASDAGGAWAPGPIRLEYGGETIEGRLVDGRFVSDLDLNVAAFAGLFQEGARMGGRVAGRVATAPVEFGLTLDGVAVAFSDKLAFDSVSGRVDHRGAAWSCERLRVRGANSEFEFDAKWEDRALTGQARGVRADLNALRELYAAARETFMTPGESAGSAAPAAAAPPPRLDFAVNLDAADYGRTEMRQVRARILSEGDLILIRDLYFVPYSGRVTGEVDVTPARGGQPMLIATRLSLQDVDARFVDHLAFEIPRELRGAITGAVNVSAPLREGVNPLNEATGTVQFVAMDGTFGQLGIATKILTVLRTTEVLHLRMPSLRDEGLAYDTCVGKARIDNGFLTLEEMAMRNPTLAVAAVGTIDFPRQDTNMAAQVQLLQSVAGVLDIVPGMQRPADELRNLSSINLRITGPPDSPNVRIESSEGGNILLDTVRGTARGTVRTGEGLVRDVLVEPAGEALRRILGR